ncbi:hypothetical protein B9W61_00155 [Streptomyces sp. CS057]|nr:hypothetical protein B9W61_00155 [Streptomyces sp. CS057]
MTVSGPDPPSPVHTVHTLSRPAGAAPHAFHHPGERRSGLSPLTPGAPICPADLPCPASAATAHPPGARAVVPANRPQLSAAEARARTPARRPGTGNPHLPNTWEMRVVDGARGLPGQSA